MKEERTAIVPAAGLSIMLLWVIGYTLANVIRYGSMFITQFPRSTPAEELFGAAAVLFLLACPDDRATRAIRTPVIRSQIQCWAAWGFLLGVMFIIEPMSLGLISLLPFAIAMSLLALWSLVVLYRPRDLLGGGGKTQ
jgi:hypothetical protein